MGEQMSDSYMGFPLCKRCKEPIVGDRPNDTDVCESCWHEFVCEESANENRLPDEPIYIESVSQAD